MNFKLQGFPKIVNIVSLWDLGRRVEIKGKSGKTSKRFNADVIKDNKKSLLVFESGKIIATGFTSVQNAKHFIKQTFPSDRPSFVNVVNMTASGALNLHVDVFKFVQNNRNVSYEPEIYPAIYWKDNKVCVTYYPKGSYIVTGVRSRKQLSEISQKFFKSLAKYINAPKEN
ncbi:TATA box-binding protein-like protein 1 [Tetranychus urticae]|uniref:TATA box-binding protein-like protein 1 n=1 Tax=Tetranychus urticae TaxID=32264 RepID=UPI00077B9C59|nr:TATA box-binding protein-like protein 1 [Tetranychus urticae]